MRYREIKVKCYGTGESGPFAELENGRRVYGLTGVAPELLRALEDCIRSMRSLMAESGNVRRTDEWVVGAGIAAIAKANGEA